MLTDSALFDACFDIRTGEGVRAALAVMAGDETAISRATPGGWLELLVASVRHQYPQLKAHSEHASLAERCVGVKGPGLSEEMDLLLKAVIEVNAAETVGVCSHHMDTWFLAHLAELLVSAAGEGAGAGHADASAGALPNSPFGGSSGGGGGGLLGGGGYRPGGGAVRGSSAALTGAVLRRPVAQGGTQAEQYLMEYCCALATRPATRHLALRYLPHCRARGAGVTSTVLRAAAPPPAPTAAPLAAAAAEQDAGDATAADAEFVATYRALEACGAAGLRGAALGVARAAAATARSRGDKLGAVAWLHRAGDVAGVAAMALEQLPSREGAAADPARAAATLVTLAAAHPGGGSGRGGGGGGGGGGGERGDGAWAGGTVWAPSVVTATGPAGFLDALAALRANLSELAGVGAASGDGVGGASAAAAVAAPSTAAMARRGGSILTALLSHGGGQRHLWTEALFQAVPLLEGAHAALDPAEIQLCLARLEQLAASGNTHHGSLEVRAEAALTSEADLRVAVARTALARAYARACVAPRGGGAAAGVVR